MRIKQSALVVTFGTTAAAMAAECLCTGHGLPGRMIPVPRAITAGCGLAWKAPPETKEALICALETAGIVWTEMRVMLV